MNESKSVIHKVSVHYLWSRVLVLALTKHYEDRKDENKIEFEEDFASKGVDFIGKGCMRGERG